MKCSESIANIAGALVKVQAEIKNPIKTAENKGVQGAPKYATLEDTLSEYVRPVLSKHGIAVYQSVTGSSDDSVGVKTVLLHESGEYIESDYIYCNVVIPVSKEGKKILTEGQATGVCITYLRRYSLNAALGINGDKDTDGSYGEIQEEPLTYKSALAYVITFGKHNGETLKDIYKTDRSYVDYLSDKGDDRIKEAINIINAEIEKLNAKKRNEAKKEIEHDRFDEGGQNIQ